MNTLKATWFLGTAILLTMLMAWAVSGILAQVSTAWRLAW